MFASNSYFNQYGNGDFFLNMISFLADDAGQITVGRPDTGKPLLFTREQASLIFWIVLVLMPLLALVSGAVVYRVRRSQR
jgi:ABC-type uncharacterized transport system involved in gliding motility auxiliary subunit